MKKIILLLIGIVALGLGWYVFQHYLPEASSVTAINDDVSALEAELATIDAEVQAGTLSPEAAVVARAKIADRLTSINTSVKQTLIKDLSPEQKVRLQEALSKLSTILVTYQASLAQVEVAAEAAIAAKPSLNRGGKSRSIASAVNSIVATVETNPDVEVTVDDLGDLAADIEDQTEAAQDEQSDSMDEATTTDDSMATTTDDGAGDDPVETATTTDEGTAVEVDSELSVDATATSTDAGEDEPMVQ